MTVIDGNQTWVDQVAQLQERVRVLERALARIEDADVCRAGDPRAGAWACAHCGATASTRDGVAHRPACPLSVLQEPTP